MYQLRYRVCSHLSHNACEPTLLPCISRWNPDCSHKDDSNTGLLWTPPLHSMASAVTMPAWQGSDVRGLAWTRQEHKLRGAELDAFMKKLRMDFTQDMGLTADPQVPPATPYIPRQWSKPYALDPVPFPSP